MSPPRPTIELTFPSLRTYNTVARRRQPLVDWLLHGLEQAGCRILMRPDPAKAPFVLVLEAPITGEQIGVVAYLFTSTSREIKNRPDDEARFQLKYGRKDGEYHSLYHDEAGRWITMLAGMRPEEFQLVAACLHPVTERWEFVFRTTDHMAPHPVCVGRLHHNVLITRPPWTPDLETLLTTL